MQYFSQIEYQPAVRFFTREEIVWLRSDHDNIVFIKDGKYCDVIFWMLPEPNALCLLQ